MAVTRMATMMSGRGMPERWQQMPVNVVLRRNGTVGLIMAFINRMVRHRHIVRLVGNVGE